MPSGIAINRAFENRLTSVQLRIAIMGKAERAMKLGDEVGGHLVSGHVDGMVKIISVNNEGDARRFTLEAYQYFISRWARTRDSRSKYRAWFTS